LVTLIGRANVGKSSLINAMVGQKVSIVSDKPQTTRSAARAVLSLPGAQVVFVDTPGSHKPRTLLGQQLNQTALGAVEGVDVVVVVVDGRSGVGGGDRFVVDRLEQRHICVVNKVDRMPRSSVLAQLQVVGEWGFEEYFAVSARTGAGLDDLVAALARRVPPGPALYPDQMRELEPKFPAVKFPGHRLSGRRFPEARFSGAERLERGPAVRGWSRGPRDMDERQWVAELVREQLLAITRDELPYSIACEVTEWEWPYVRCEILVERESQKGIVIGRGGAVLKRVGSAVRVQLPPGVYLELSVRVARDWQQKPEALRRLGL
jgi:GTP-binding protein Era